MVGDISKKAEKIQEEIDKFSSLMERERQGMNSSGKKLQETQFEHNILFTKAAGRREKTLNELKVTLIQGGDSIGPMSGEEKKNVNNMINLLTSQVTDKIPKSKKDILTENYQKYKSEVDKHMKKFYEYQGKVNKLKEELRSLEGFGGKL